MKRTIRLPQTIAKMLLSNLYDDSSFLYTRSSGDGVVEQTVTGEDAATTTGASSSSSNAFLRREEGVWEIESDDLKIDTLNCRSTSAVSFFSSFESVGGVRLPVSNDEEQEDHHEDCGLLDDETTSFADYCFSRRFTSSGRSGATENVIDATAHRKKKRRARATNMKNLLSAALQIVRADAGEQRGQQEEEDVEDSDSVCLARDRGVKQATNGARCRRRKRVRECIADVVASSCSNRGHIIDIRGNRSADQQDDKEEEEHLDLELPLGAKLSSLFLDS